MNKLVFFFTFAIIFSVAFIPVHESHAQTVVPPRHQWKQINNIDELTCEDGLVLLQKNNGSPACVSPTAYFKLVDRDYGMYDASLMMKRPVMMSNLMKHVVSNNGLMTHWHDMMLQDPVMMKNTMNDWVSLMKDNTNYLTNMMGPMTSDPKLREQMIEHMREHPQMESSLKANQKWMDSVHQPMMGSGMHQGMPQNMQHGICQWCPNYDTHTMLNQSMEFAKSDRIMDMLHHMWLNNKQAHDIYKLMLSNPSHMAQMQEQMMEPMLRHMMNDPELRQQMIELMLEHSEFMDSIRHENTQGN